MSRRLLEIPGSSTVDARGPEFYSLSDLYIGAELSVFGRRFVITGCDETVKKYLDQSGVHLPAVCRESIDQYLATGDNSIMEQKHVKVPVA